MCLYEGKPGMDGRTGKRIEVLEERSNFIRLTGFGRGALTRKKPMEFFRILFTTFCPASGLGVRLGDVPARE